MKRSWDDSYDSYSGSYQDYSYDGNGYSGYSRDDEYFTSDSLTSRGGAGGSSSFRSEASSSYYGSRSAPRGRGAPPGRSSERSGGGSGFVNPEYYDRGYGSRFEGTKAGAVNPYDDSASKKRKVENLSLCVDFVRGYCTKGSMCPKPHVDYVESIDEREVIAKVKFCHNFQNRGVCFRPQGCHFLHVTRREEDEFLLTGVIPQTVFERTAEQGGFRGGNDRPSNRGGPRGGGRGGGGRGGGGGGRGGGGYGGRGRGGSRDSFIGHSTSKPVTYSSYCVDFLKGTCTKGPVCTLKHVECVEDEEDRAGIVANVFCHDFLNHKCKRASCKYVHATREEEEYFLANGFFAPTINARNKEKLFYSDICLDFLRNQCIRGSKCNYKHVSNVDDMNERKVLSRSIFCHDFQDGACSRPSCKLLHTSIQDELYFLNNGRLPGHLSVPSGATSRDPNLEKIAKNVCRDYIKNRCEYGDKCRFYHPSAVEIQALIANSNVTTGGQQWSQSSTSSFNTPSTSAPSQSSTSADMSQDNEALQARVKQLERLLADACYCMTLAVGDQHPAISTLMKTITELAPSSTLANQGQGQGGDAQETQEAASSSQTNA